METTLNWYRDGVFEISTASQEVKSQEALSQNVIERRGKLHGSRSRHKVKIRRTTQTNMVDGVETAREVKGGGGGLGLGFIQIKVFSAFCERPVS